jgi:hypothetical protein
MRPCHDSQKLDGLNTCNDVFAAKECRSHGSMKGRSRAYALTARNPPGKSALSVAFNDRCDMIVTPYPQALSALHSSSW